MCMEGMDHGEQTYTPGVQALQCTTVHYSASNFLEITHTKIRSLSYRSQACYTRCVI